jgi:hypothetical protein
MGTSTGYNAPTTPEWQAVKTEVSREAPNGRPAPEVAARIVSDYIRASGGPRAISKGKGPLGQTKAAQSVAARIAGFLGSVSEHGLPEALRRSGWALLVGRPVTEILAGLLDALGGPAHSLDDVDARNALSRLQDDLLGDAVTADQVEQILKANAEDSALTLLITRFYMHYLYEQFCRVFYERLVMRVGDTTADSFLAGIQDFLESALHEQVQQHGIEAIDWTEGMGQSFADELLERTLRVFGGEG